MKIQISSKFGTVFLVIVDYLYINDSSRSEPSEEQDNNFVEIRIARKKERECTWTVAWSMYGVFPVSLGQFTSLGPHGPKCFGRAE